MFLRFALLSVLLAWSAIPRAQAAEPFLEPNDVIALIGGEDMVAAAEYGYLELLLQRALPDYRLKVRSLAWEGDTVYEQQRDLNYPTLEQQLDEIGATVVIMQFGQMESLDGTNKLPEFIKAYEKLIERVGKGGTRRVILELPRRLGAVSQDLDRKALTEEAKAHLKEASSALEQYRQASMTLRGSHRVLQNDSVVLKSEVTRDGIHTAPAYLGIRALKVASMLVPGRDLLAEIGIREPNNPVLTAIRAKNRLWFHYYRPQNWAFLAGDRTEQPSSRDHKDPTKRWFPEEMKQYLPLIEQKEKEIWELAAKAAKP